MTEPISKTEPLAGKSVYIISHCAKDTAKENLELLARQNSTTEVQRQIGFMEDLLNKHPEKWSATSVIDGASPNKASKSVETMLVYDDNDINANNIVVVTKNGNCSVSLEYGSDAFEIGKYKKLEELVGNLNPRFVALRVLEIKRDKPESGTMPLSSPIDGHSDAYLTKGGTLTNTLAHCISIHLLDPNQPKDKEMLTRVGISS